MADKKRALVVDDMEVNRNLLKSFLFFMHFEVELAADGVQARELLAAGRFDLVVSDIEMPNMNGFELLSAVKKAPATAGIPVIMLSSLESPEVVERCRRLGAAAYIVKPFTKEKLEAALRQAGL